MVQTSLFLTAKDDRCQPMMTHWNQNLLSPFESLGFNWHEIRCRLKLSFVTNLTLTREDNLNGGAGWKNLGHSLASLLFTPSVAQRCEYM